MGQKNRQKYRQKIRQKIHQKNSSNNSPKNSSKNSSKIRQVKLIMSTHSSQELSELKLDSTSKKSARSIF